MMWCLRFMHLFDLILSLSSERLRELFVQGSDQQTNYIQLIDLFARAHGVPHLGDHRLEKQPRGHRRGSPLPAMPLYNQ